MRAAYNRLGMVLSYAAWPALYIYLRRGARTRVLVLADNKLLLVRGWLDNGGWGLPGGGLHRNEDPVAGAIREVREETALLLQAKDFTHLSSEWLYRQHLKAYCHIFAVRLENTASLVPQRGEIIAAEWISLNDLPNMQHKAEIDRALQLLAAGS